MDPMVEPWDDEGEGEVRSARNLISGTVPLLVIPDAAERRSGTQDSREADEGNAAAEEVSRAPAFAGMTVSG